MTSESLISARKAFDLASEVLAQKLAEAREMPHGTRAAHIREAFVSFKIAEDDLRIEEEKYEMEIEK